jgi:hypothetical protein
VKCPEGYQWTNGKCQECHCNYVDVKFWGDNSTAVTGLTTGPYTGPTSTTTTGGYSTTSGTTGTTTSSNTSTSGSTTSTGSVQYKCPQNFQLTQNADGKYVCICPAPFKLNRDTKVC